MISNLGAWQTMTFWSLAAISVCYLLSRFLITKPRARATLILTGFVCAFLPLATPTAMQVEGQETVQVEQQMVTQMAFPRPEDKIPTKPVETPQSAPSSVPSSISLWDAFVMLWILGSSTGIVWLFGEIWKMNLLAKRGTVPSPMVAGFPKTKILLPLDWPGNLSSAEAEAALAHEQAHIKGLHVPGRIMAELFRCLFWWLPTAHLSARLYQQSLEEIADAEAILTTEPQSLANALLKVAERGSQPYLCTGVTSQGKILESRIRKIMKNQKSGRWPAATLLAVTAFAAAFAAAPKLPIQQDPVGVKPIFGLSKGATWKYDRSFGYGKGAGRGQVQYLVSKVIPTKGITVYELTHEKNYYYYQGVSSDGLFEMGRTRMAEPGFDPENPDCLIRKPYTVGATWKWHSVFRGQIMSDGSGKFQFKDYDSDCVATIEAEENLTVPAGTFHCYKVHVKSTSKANRPGDYIQWVSLESGLIQKKVMDENGNVIDHWTLVKFVPGNQSPGG